MANFSENQVRHLYVVNDAAELASVTAGQGYLVIKDALGNFERTDLVKNILSAKATLASSMARNLKVTKVVMDSSVNSGNPIAGQDYVIRLEYRQFIAKSDETFYHEFGSTKAKSGQTATDLLRALGANLALNTKKQEMVSVALSGTYGASSTDVEVALELPSFSTSTAYAAGDIVLYTDGKTYRFNATHSAGAWSTSDVDEVTITGLLIKEIAQDWVLGVKEQTPVYFETSCSTVAYNGDDVAWGVVSDASTNTAWKTTINNGKIIADLEFFLMGERGDMYRMISYPNFVKTTYKVNASQAYDAIDIHYAYVGDNHSVQKSEKTLTIVYPNSIASTVKTAVNSAFGLSL